MNFSQLSFKTQNQLNLTADEKQFVRGSLECMIEAGELKTSAPIDDVEAMLIAQANYAKAMNAWDKCPIDSDEWDTLQESAKYAGNVADEMAAKI